MGNRKSGLETKRTTGVDQDLGKAGCPPSTDFSPDAFAEVDDARPDDEPPTQISETVLSRIEGEYAGPVWVGGISDEASSGMSVQSKHEEKCQMVGVPEGFKALLADFLMSS